MTRSVLIRMAGVLAATAATAACSGDISRFGSEPMYTASTDNQREILGGQSSGGASALPVSTPQPAVTSSALPAPTVQASAPTPTSATYAAATSVTPATAAADGVQYRGWSSVGGTPITVAQGDSATTLSRRYGVPEDALVATNRLGSTADITPGRQIVIPVYSAGGAPAATTLAAAPAAGAAGTGLAPGPQNLAAQVPPGATESHRVAPGETLNSIARSYAVPVASIVTANNLTDTNAIRVGQVLRMPGAQATATRTAALAPATATDAEPIPSQPPAKPAIATAAPAAAAPAQPAEQQVASLAPAATAGKVATDAAAAAPPAAEDGAEAEDSAGGFRWPARGRIIAGFGRKSSGEQNDGINIALPEGTPIKAAEGGVVIYAGNELSGFGNLLLIRHDNGWVTAYAHNKDLLVGRGATVKRGQVIAYAGATGSVTQPQLHFELRKGSQPVDPLPHLSGA